MRIPLRLLICLETISVVLCEWIELPQFSDDAKVYRPSLFNFQRQKPGREFGPRGLKNVTRLRSKNRQFSNFGPLFGQARVTLSNITIVDDDEEDREESLEESEELEDTQIEAENFDSRPTESTIMEPELTATVEPSAKKGNDTADNKDNGFMDYLPVELLRQVHQTLKAQPKTLKGKIRFLKGMEKALLNEIESRLTTSLQPTRVPRSSEHGSEEIGTVEGALMIISLLTFAVYLVRLVMAVIWNLKGNSSSQTIFVGRRKRSINEPPEDMLRILNYVDNLKFDDYGK